MTTTMTTGNVNRSHDTVREGVKSWMESVQSTAASTPPSLVSDYFLVKISGHTLLLQRLFSSSSNGEKIITATWIPISSLLRVSQSLLSFLKTMSIQARFYQTKIEEYHCLQ